MNDWVFDASMVYIMYIHNFSISMHGVMTNFCDVRAMLVCLCACVLVCFPIAAQAVWNSKH